MYRILILGGTGAMGVSLVEILSKEDVDIYITSRTPKTSHKKNVHYICGNAHNDEFFFEQLKYDYDCIVDFMIYTTNEFKKRVEKILSSTKQYIYLSSSRVYANSSTPLTEKSPRLLDVCEDLDYLSTDEYALSKARQEDILLNSGKKNFTIIRPYITYNDTRLQLGVLEKEYWLERALNNHTIVFSKDIADHITTLTFGHDVSYLMSKLIGNEKAYGEIFHITSNESIKWQEILDIYIKVLKKHGLNPKIKIPKNSKMIEQGLGNYYQIHYDRLYDRIFDNSKILEVSGHKDYKFMKIEKGLETCLDNFIDNKYLFLNKSYKLDALFDQECNEFTNIIKIYGLKSKAKYLLYRYFKN